jgi:hypothetical protein
VQGETRNDFGVTIYRIQDAGSSLDLEFWLNVLDGLLIFGIALPTVYLTTKIGQRKLRVLTLLLAVFLILHGLYHITAALGGVPGLDFFGPVADTFVEPVGWVVFLAFAVYFTRNS